MEASSGPVNDIRSEDVFYDGSRRMVLRQPAVRRSRARIVTSVEL